MSRALDPLKLLEEIRAVQTQPMTGGEYEVVLKSKVRVQVSRRFRKRLQERMGAMSGRDLQAVEKRLEAQRFAQLKEHQKASAVAAPRRPVPYLAEV